MNRDEAKAWLNGTRSMTNAIPEEPRETWQERVARADAAMMEQAYWVLRAETLTTPEQPAVEGDCGCKTADEHLECPQVQDTPPPVQGLSLREAAQVEIRWWSGFLQHEEPRMRGRTLGVYPDVIRKMIGNLRAALARDDVEAAKWEAALAELRRHMTCNHLRVCVRGQVMDGKPNIVCSNHRYLAALTKEGGS